MQALWDFDGSGSSGLSFKAGDILTVTSKDMGDWWDAELDGQTGIIPSTFVEEIWSISGVLDNVVDWFPLFEMIWWVAVS